jgi:hypothetical protein
MEEAWRKAMIAWTPETYLEKREQEAEYVNQMLMKNYKDTTRFELLSIKRYLLPTNKPIFEDQKGNLKKITSAITAKINVRVLDPRTIKHGGNLLEVEKGFAFYTYKVGHFLLHT